LKYDTVLTECFKTLFRQRYVIKDTLIEFPRYRSFVTTESQPKMCDFSGEIFKGFEVL